MDDKIKIAAKPIQSIEQLVNTIVKLYDGKLNTKTVTNTFNLLLKSKIISSSTILKRIIPFIQSVIFNVKNPELIAKINSNFPDAVTVLSRDEVFFALIGGFFNIFKNDHLRGVFLAAFNGYLLGLQCIFNYFRRVCDYISDDRDLFFGGKIIIKRVVEGPTSPSDTSREKSDGKLVEILMGNGDMEDSPAKLHLVSPDRRGFYDSVYIWVRPEALIANIAYGSDPICVLGAEKMIDRVNDKYIGNFIDSAPLGYSPDDTEVLLQHVLIISHRDLENTAGYIDYLNKILLTFKFSRTEMIALDYPGDGYNNQRVFIEQIIAASQSKYKYDLVYYTDEKYEKSVVNFIARLNASTLGNLQRAFEKTTATIGAKDIYDGLDLFSHIGDSL